MISIDVEPLSFGEIHQVLDANYIAKAPGQRYCRTFVPCPTFERKRLTASNYHQQIAQEPPSHQIRCINSEASGSSSTVVDEYDCRGQDLLCCIKS